MELNQLLNKILKDGERFRQISNDPIKNNYYFRFEKLKNIFLFIEINTNKIILLLTGNTFSCIDISLNDLNKIINDKNEIIIIKRLALKKRLIND